MVSLKDARYQVLKNLFGPLVTDMLVPTEIVGESNIPSRGPALLVCNHRSMMDPFIFSARSRRVVNWVMAPFVSSIPLFGWLAEQAGAISIIKSEEGKSEALIDSMESVWRQGRLVGIFPEGMANFNEPVGPTELHDFHGTFLRAVLRARIPNLPVIPAAVYSRKEAALGEVNAAMLQIFDRTEKQFDHGGMTLIGYNEALILIGKPLYFDDYYAQYAHSPDRQEPAEQTELVNGLVGTVRQSVCHLLERAAMLDAPTPPMPQPLPGRP
jgi:1-acyl-sn-glycerol-3-phosphate acyltransferase